MTKARPLSTYPNAHYLALIARVRESGAPFLVPCTPPQAASLRGELYAWRRACLARPDEAQAEGIDPDILATITWRIRPDGLETTPVAALPGPALIEQALGHPPETAEAKAAEALARLRANLGEPNGR